VNRIGRDRGAGVAAGNTCFRMPLGERSGCLSRRSSMMLEEVIKLHRFAGISPEQSFTEAGRHREAVVAAD
jgi:hypothetical protein